MHNAGINWGTYQDAFCVEGQYHCNAHANNLVLVPPGALPDGAPGFQRLVSHEIYILTELPTMPCATAGCCTGPGHGI